MAVPYQPVRPIKRNQSTRAKYTVNKSPAPAAKPAPAPAAKPAPAPAAKPAPAPAAKPAPAPAAPNTTVIDVIQRTPNGPDLIARNGPSSNMVHPDIVIALLFGLIIVNGFSSGQFQNIASVITKKSTDTKTSHTNFLTLGGEIVFAIGLSLIAGINDSANKFILVFVFALWLLWGVQNTSHISSFAKKVGATK